MAWSIKRKSDIPDGTWMLCSECNKMVYKKEVEERLNVCPKCNFHFPITPSRRLEIFLDPESFEELFANVAPTDPLNFVDRISYKKRLAEYQEETGLKDAVVTGKGRLKEREIAVGVMDSRFIMASMGAVVGEKITRLFEYAAVHRLPVVIFCASGGARMQEGLISLMQMAKTSAAVARFRQSSGLFISVLTNPTTAGVLASFASLGDLLIAEPKALIGFTGPRVIKETIKAELPKGFQTSEFLLDHGLIDLIVPRKDLRDDVATLIEYLVPRKTAAPVPEHPV